MAADNSKSILSSFKKKKNQPATAQTPAMDFEGRNRPTSQTAASSRRFSTPATGNAAVFGQIAKAIKDIPKTSAPGVGAPGTLSARAMENDRAKGQDWSNASPAQLAYNNTYYKTLDDTNHTALYTSLDKMRFDHSRENWESDFTQQYKYGQEYLKKELEDYKSRYGKNSNEYKALQQFSDDYKWLARQVDVDRANYRAKSYSDQLDENIRAIYGGLMAKPEFQAKAAEGAEGLSKSMLRYYETFDLDYENASDTQKALLNYIYATEGKKGINQFLASGLGQLMTASSANKLYSSTISNDSKAARGFTIGAQDVIQGMTGVAPSGKRMIEALLDADVDDPNDKNLGGGYTISDSIDAYLADELRPTLVEIEKEVRPKLDEAGISGSMYDLCVAKGRTLLSGANAPEWVKDAKKNASDYQMEVLAFFAYAAGEGEAKAVWEEIQKREEMIWNATKKGANIQAKNVDEMLRQMYDQYLGLSGAVPPGFLSGTDGATLPQTLHRAANSAAENIVTIGLQYGLSSLGVPALPARILSAIPQALDFGGKGYVEALEQGADRNKAKGYGFTQAGVEYVTDVLLGGMGKLGGVLTGGVRDKVVSKIASPLFRALVDLGVRAGFEFTQEHLQQALEPIWSAYFLDKGDVKQAALDFIDPRNIIDEDRMYAGFLGALSSIMMSAPGAIGDIRTNTFYANLGKSARINDSLGKMVDLILNNPIEKGNGAQREMYEDAKTTAELIKNGAKVSDLAAGKMIADFKRAGGDISHLQDPRNASYNKDALTEKDLLAGTVSRLVALGGNVALAGDIVRVALGQEVNSEAWEKIKNDAKAAQVIAELKGDLDMTKDSALTRAALASTLTDTEDETYDTLVNNNPDQNVVNPATKQLLDLGVDLEEATNIGNVLAKVMRGEAITEDEAELISVSNAAVRNVLSERLGIELAEDATIGAVMDALNDYAADAAKTKEMQNAVADEAGRSANARMNNANQTFTAGGVVFNHDDFIRDYMAQHKVSREVAEEAWNQRVGMNAALTGENLADQSNVQDAASDTVVQDAAGETTENKAKVKPKARQQEATRTRRVVIPVKVATREAQENAATENTEENNGTESVLDNDQGRDSSLDNRGAVQTDAERRVGSGQTDGSRTAGEHSESGEEVLQPENFIGEVITELDSEQKDFVYACKSDGFNSVTLVRGVLTTVNGNEINAKVDRNGNLVIRWDNPYVAPKKVALHEKLHRWLDVLGDGRASFVRGALNEIFNGREDVLQNAIEVYAQRYRGAYSSLSDEAFFDAVAEELLCDLYAGVDLYGAGTEDFFTRGVRFIDDSYLGEEFLDTNNPNEQFALFDVDGSDDPFEKYKSGRKQRRGRSLNFYGAFDLNDPFFNSVDWSVPPDARPLPGENPMHVQLDRLSLTGMADGGNFDLVQNDEGYPYALVDRRTGERVENVTEDMLIGTPLGNIIQMAVRSEDNPNGITEDEAKAQRQMMADAMNLIIKYKDAAVVWELVGSQLFSAVKANSDTQYNKTIDFTTICSKTMAIVDRMSETMKRLGRGLTRREVEIIYEETGRSGQATPCPVCYVFSRWMGIGNLLDQIRVFQEQYAGQSEEQLISFMQTIEGKVEAFVNDLPASKREEFYDKHGRLKIGKALSEMKSGPNSQAAKAIEKLQQHQMSLDAIANLQALMPNATAEQAARWQQLITTLENNRLTEEQIQELNDQMAESDADVSKLEAYQWLAKTAMMRDSSEVNENGEAVESWKKNPAYKPVPNDILFDLNRGGDFAENYPLTWAFRTGKGCAMGKAILPYSDARVGETIQGVALSDVKNIRTGGMAELQKILNDETLTRRQKTRAKNKLNEFLTGDTKKALKTLETARRKQRQQNLIGGMRYQSTSDFRYEFGSDYLMSFLEMQAIGANVQLYTKVIEAVDFLASTGADCNLSVMPLADGFEEYTDPKTGKTKERLIFSNVTGINAEAAIKKSQQYDNVQLILVGINDTNIRLALEGEEVTFVIPFHGSGQSVHQIQTLMDMIGEHLDVTQAQDYTDVQSDHVSPNQTTEQKAMWNLRMAIIMGKCASGLNSEQKALLGKNAHLQKLYDMFYVDESSLAYHNYLAEDQAKQIFPYEYWDKTTTYETADRNGEIFQDYCQSMGIIPRFSGYNSKGERVDHGDFSKDKGYWKLLIDRSMYKNKYDENGNWIGYGAYRDQQQINMSNVKISDLDPKTGEAQFQNGEMSKRYNPRDPANQQNLDSVVTKSIQRISALRDKTDVFREGDIYDKTRISKGARQGLMDAQSELRDRLSLTPWQNAAYNSSNQSQGGTVNDQGRTDQNGRQVHYASERVSGEHWTQSYFEGARANHPGIQPRQAWSLTEPRSQRVNDAIKDFFSHGKNTISGLRLRDAVEAEYGIADLANWIFDLMYKTSPEEATNLLRQKITNADELIGQIEKALTTPDSTEFPQGYTPTKLDQEYQAALKAGDMVKLYDMVSRAAKRAGYTKEVFQHSWWGGRFDSFGKGEFGFHVGPWSQAASLLKFNNSDEEIILPLYSDFKNPYNIEVDLGEWDVRRVALAIIDQIDDGTSRKLKPYRATLEAIANRTGSETTDYDSILRKQLTDILEAAGYDSIRYENRYEDPEQREAPESFILWHPDQLKSADLVTYNEDGSVIPLSERFNKQTPEYRYSLTPVAAVQPSSDSWNRTHTTEEAVEAYPDLWKVDAEESEEGNPTQRAGTVSTYRNIYKILRGQGFDGKILDASSGLGIGTQIGRNEFGFDVEDIEPYPGENYSPMYTDYSKLNNKYDAIISSAVLNVLPQDQRDALVVKMGELLNDGGKMYITTRGKDVDSLAKTGKNIQLGPMEWIETVHGSYQKGFTQNELKAYLEDALGPGFTVELSNKENGGKFNNNTSIVVTKNGATQNEAETPQERYSAAPTNQDSNNAPFKDGSFEKMVYDLLQKANSPQELQDMINKLIEQRNQNAQRNNTPPVIPAKDRTPPVNSEQRKIQQNQLQDLIDEYGQLEQGENPAKDVALPKRTSDERYVRRFVRTAEEAAGIPERMNARIEDSLLTKDLLTYSRITDKAAVKRGDSKFEKLGYKNAVKEWNDNIASSYSRPTKFDIAFGERLLVEAARNGDEAVALKVLADLSSMATQAGQVVQASRLLKKLGPTGQLYYVQKAVDRLNKQNEGRIAKGKMDPVVINKTLAKAVILAETDKQMQDAMDKLLDSIAEQLPVTLRDKWDAWRYLSMLGNPRTHIRNIAGNAVFMPVRFVKDILSATGQNLLIKDPMQRTKNVAAHFASRKYADIRKYAAADFEEMKPQITGNGKMNPLNEIMDRRKIFKTLTFLNGWSDFNFDRLEKEDAFFLRKAYIDSFTQFLAAKGLSLEDLNSSYEGGKILNEARQFAALEAQKATYRDFNQLATYLNNAKRIPILGMGIDGLMAFTKTPMNILRRGIEYSPVGLANGIYSQLVRVGNGDISAADAIDQVAAGMTGSMIAALGFFLAKLGVARGGDDDDKKKAQLEAAQGHQKYSLEINGKSYTIDWMAPVAIPFFVGVELFNQLNDDGPVTWWDAVNALTMIAEPMMSLSMLDGINRTLSSIRYGDEDEAVQSVATSILTSYLAQGVPTLFGQIARTLDPDRRSTYTDKNKAAPAWWQQFAQGIQGKNFISALPNSADDKMAYIDIWGRKDTTTSMLWRGLENFISPGYGNRINETPVDRELTRLAESLDDTSMFPSSVAKYFQVSGERLDLNAKQYEKYKTVVGQTAFSLLGNALDNVAYISMDDEQKAAVIENLLDISTAIGKLAVAPDYKPDAWIQRAIDLDNMEDVAMFRAIKSMDTGLSDYQIISAMTWITDEDRGKLIMEQRDNTQRKMTDYEKKNYKFILTDDQIAREREIYTSLFWPVYTELVSSREYINADVAGRAALISDMQSDLGKAARSMLGDELRAAGYTSVLEDDSAVPGKVTNLYDLLNIW